jgi:endonuclease/exonuclease/phosphatase family metal-dependent hydrolase
LTYPSTVPAKRIDFVLASRHFRVQAARVPDSQASDHRPVIVDFVVDRMSK